MWEKKVKSKKTWDKGREKNEEGEKEMSI
jgi:hypothetical protein